MKKKITLPIQDEVISTLEAGDEVLLTGILYTGRDAAHKRMVETIKDNKPLPIDLRNQTIYYVGPCPAKPGEIIGSCGPTTSGRMDAYTPIILEQGLKGMIGKGERNKAVIDAIIKNKAVYFTAIGGAGALLADRVKKAEVIAYEDLGAEAIYKLYVEDFPAVVTIDAKGNNLYDTQKEKYKKILNQA
ncbi:MAG: Fe-S-containing hydro-lyase [Epulopiscium sp.]|nr:Fe-S-containing hydro-lyase [Candidatus Epulonipiscium sp.]